MRHVKFDQPIGPPEEQLGQGLFAESPYEAEEAAQMFEQLISEDEWDETYRGWLRFAWTEGATNALCLDRDNEWREGYASLCGRREETG